MKPTIYLASPTMHEEERIYIKEAFETNWIAPLGKNVDAFEREMSDYLGCADCAAVNAGTAAMHLALRLLNIKRGDVILCPTLTFAATAVPVLYEGGRLVFVDSEEATWNMSPKALEKALRQYPECKAVILVHLYGTPAKIGEMQELCRKYQVPMIEDAAESLGASYRGVQTGTFGKFGILSFNGNKIITTSGGGILIGQNREEIRRARFLAAQAREPVRYYEHRQIGYNYRLSNVLAGIGRGQLLHLEEHIEKKRWIYKEYQKAFEKCREITMNPYDAECSSPNFWLSAIRLTKYSKVCPLDLMQALEEEGIESRPIWKPMHLQPVFAGCELITEGEKEPISEQIYGQGICLPSDIKMTKEQIEKVCEVILREIKRG